MTGPITLEQLCRDLWRADKQRYLAHWGKTKWLVLMILAQPRGVIDILVGGEPL